MGLISAIEPPEVIATSRLILRRPRISDAGDVFDAYASDMEVTRYLTWRPHTEPSTVASFLRFLLARLDSGEEYSWALTLPTDDRAIGMIACRLREHMADIGYVLSRKYWGHGYTTESAKAVVDWASRLESVYRVWAVCDVDNIASARVLENAGMQREGVLRRYIVHPNVSAEARDCFVYAKVR